MTTRRAKKHVTTHARAVVRAGQGWPSRCSVQPRIVAAHQPGDLATKPHELACPMRFSQPVYAVRRSCRDEADNAADWNGIPPLRTSVTSHRAHQIGRRGRYDAP